MQYKIVAIFHITLLYIVLIIHQFIQIPKIYDISGDPILYNKGKITNFGLKMRTQDHTNWSKLSADALIYGP